MITAADLKKLLEYDPETGMFKWLIRLSNRQRRNMVAGSRRPDGYCLIKIHNEKYLAHRLAWLFMTGEWPSLVIDHINGNPNDNRWENLREVTQSVNLLNQKCARSDNTSTRSLGVSKKRDQRKYRARIMVNSVEIYLGAFKTLEEASAAYHEAKSNLITGQAMDDLLV